MYFVKVQQPSTGDNRHKSERDLIFKKTFTGLYNENFRKSKGIAEIWILIHFNMSNNLDDFLL